MKSKVIKKSLTDLETIQLNKDQIKKIKGGTGDTTDDIVVVDIITP